MADTVQTEQVNIQDTNGQGTPEGVADTDMTFDDVLKNSKYQAEFDRRVNKALGTSREKQEADIQKKLDAARDEGRAMASMSAEELIKKERADLDKMRSALETERLKSRAKSIASERGLPSALADILRYDNDDGFASQLDTVKALIDGQVQAQIKAHIAGQTPPAASKTSENRSDGVRAEFYRRNPKFKRD